MTTPPRTPRTGRAQDRRLSLVATHRLDPRAIVAGAVFLAIIGLAIWYLARPEPLLLQGEVESTRTSRSCAVASIAVMCRS
jgi:hypothetical protein